MTKASRRPLALALLLSALCHGVVLVCMVWWMPTPAPRDVVLRHVPRRLPQAERFRAATATLPSASAWSTQRVSTLTAPDLDATDLPEPGAAVDSLHNGPTFIDVGQRGLNWQGPPDVTLPAPGALPPQPAAIPAQGPQMLADMAEKKSFALIDPETGKLMKAWLFLVASGNCGLGSAAHRLEELLIGMKRGQGSPRDLPMEYSVESLPCGQVLRARDLPRHRVILTDFVGVESPEALAQHLAAGGFAMTSTSMLHEMDRALVLSGTGNTQLVQLEPEHPLFQAFFDIDAHSFDNMLGVPRPFIALEIDGRIAAVGGLAYRQDRTSAYSAGGAIGRAAMKPHLSNLLYINALAYGLVQPSALGGRYLQSD